MALTRTAKSSAARSVRAGAEAKTAPGRPPRATHPAAQLPRETASRRGRNCGADVGLRCRSRVAHSAGFGSLSCFQTNSRLALIR